MPLLIDEVRSEQLGRGRTLDQLAQLVLTYALRWLDAVSGGSKPTRTGWLRALADVQIGAAHDRPRDRQAGVRARLCLRERV